jgi:hypothetical protein
VSSDLLTMQYDIRRLAGGTVRPFEALGRAVGELTIRGRGEAAPDGGEDQQPMTARMRVASAVSDALRSALR